ncbi:hypothetical protein HO173_004211 [Letharia columbiana]|uniref:Uncharacterized protein n=1 Tax=Letharia columbiana TaxID=112416 RepID=A0A8H6G001_9LECA|nr:uncharacterized protein HO173_004211 [Letharia columbiana]KAF6238010.1 hypothetical protein HO173_004211 [Letharia columbiana]
MPSPGIWKFAFVRDPEDVLESAKGYERRRSENSAQFRATVSDGNGKLNQEFRTIKSEKLT